ncbi:MAG: hypothetical protein WCR51_13575 [Planctomycetia bacterium]
MRADLDGCIVPAMAGRRKREIRDQDVQGLEYLRKIRPVLSRLRKVGTERDRAGKRRLFMDQYCALILMPLFSPAIQSRPNGRFDAVGQRITAVDGTVIETVKQLLGCGHLFSDKHNGVEIQAYCAMIIREDGGEMVRGNPEPDWARRGNA